MDCARHTLDTVAADEGIILVGRTTGRLGWLAHRISPKGYQTAARFVMRSFRSNRLQN